MDESGASREAVPEPAPKALELHAAVQHWRVRSGLSSGWQPKRFSRDACTEPGANADVERDGPVAICFCRDLIFWAASLMVKRWPPEDSLRVVGKEALKEDIFSGNRESGEKRFESAPPHLFEVYV